MNTEPVTRPPMVRRWELWAAVVAAAAAIAVIVLVFVGRSGNEKKAESQQPTTVKAAGVMTLNSTSITYPVSGGCEGKGGYSDIHEGAQVVVSDSTGRTVALGQLEQGISVGTGKCAFSFEIDTVPAGEEFYQVEVSHRGKLQFSAGEIGSLDLTLGND